jgi:hypothetical protein
LTGQKSIEIYPRISTWPCHPAVRRPKRDLRGIFTELLAESRFSETDFLPLKKGGGWGIVAKAPCVSFCKVSPCEAELGVVPPYGAGRSFREAKRHVGAGI